MWLPWASKELGDLVHSIHGIWASGLSQVVQLAHNRVVVEIKIKRRSIFVSMEQLSNFFWDRLSLGIIQANILDDGVNKSLLSEFIGSVLHLLNVHTNIIGWMTLILNVETCFLDITNGCLEFLIIWSKKYAIVNIDHENIISFEEHTVVNHEGFVSQGNQLLHQELIPYSTCLLLAINILQ
jgi:hypothetical protein